MKKGFTLIELLIVVSIIGILAVALIPSLTDAPARARDAGRKAAVNEVVAAVESYNIDNGNYPSVDTGDNGCLIVVASGCTAGVYSGSDDVEELVCEYMNNQPPTSNPVSTETAMNNTTCTNASSTFVKYADSGTAYSVSIATETGTSPYTVDRN